MPELLNRNPIVAIGFLGALVLGMLVGGKRRQSVVPLPRAKEMMVNIPRSMVLKADDPEHTPGLLVNLVKIEKGVLICSITSKPLSLHRHRKHRLVLGPTPSIAAVKIILTRQRGYKFIPADNPVPSCNHRTEIVYGQT